MYSHVQRDRMCQIIKCNPWSTSLCPHPTHIKKMKTYLELEGKLGPKSKIQPQQDQSGPAQPNINPLVRREAKATDKKRKLILTKRYKVQVVAKPKSTSKVNNTATQSSAIVPNTTMNSEKENTSQGNTSGNNPHQLKIFQPMLALHGLQQSQCQETYLS